MSLDVSIRCSSGEPNASGKVTRRTVPKTGCSNFQRSLEFDRADDRDSASRLIDIARFTGDILDLHGTSHIFCSPWGLATDGFRSLVHRTVANLSEVTDQEVPGTAPGTLPASHSAWRWVGELSRDSGQGAISSR
jgi:hypothetical protein